jgi:hypothetical protein
VARSSRLQTAGLVVLFPVVAALGMVNWWVIQLDPAPAAAGERMVLASTGSVPVSLGAPSEERALSDFDEVVRRPVFTASRRPFVQPEPARREATRVLPPPDLRLMGVALDGNRKQALLRTGQQPRARWVDEGETIEGGWVLRTVQADAAVLASGQQTHEVRLYPSSPAKQ